MKNLKLYSWLSCCKYIGIGSLISDSPSFFWVKSSVRIFLVGATVTRSTKALFLGLFFPVRDSQIESRLGFAFVGCASLK